MENNDILIWGCGRPCADVKAHIPSVSVCFDRDTGIIHRAEITEVTGLAREFVMDLLIGYDLNKGPDVLLGMLENRYYGSGKQAVENAVKGIFDTFSEIRCGSGAEGALK